MMGHGGGRAGGINWIGEYCQCRWWHWFGRGVKEEVDLIGQGGGRAGVVILAGSLLLWLVRSGGVADRAIRCSDGWGGTSMGAGGGESCSNSLCSHSSSLRLHSLYSRRRS